MESTFSGQSSVRSGQEYAGRENERVSLDLASQVTAMVSGKDVFRCGMHYNRTVRCELTACEALLMF